MGSDENRQPKATSFAARGWSSEQRLSPSSATTVAAMPSSGLCRLNHQTERQVPIAEGFFIPRSRVYPA
jgi:hypothetical protein